MVTDQNKELDNKAGNPTVEHEPDSPQSVGVHASANGGGGEDMRGLTIPEELAILPLREMVVFPVLVSPIAVSRESSVQLVDEAVAAGDRIIGVVAMPDSSIEKPTAKDIYPIGCAVVIRMMAKAHDGIKMIVQGVSRFEILQVLQEEPYLKARVRVIEAEDLSALTPDQKLEIEAMRRQIGNLYQRLVQLSPQLPDELQSLATSIEDPAQMTDLIAAHMPIQTSEKQEILQARPLHDRMAKLLGSLTREVQMMELGSKLQSDVASEINKTQRDYYLREQMKAIQKELGEGDERGTEVEELKAKVAEAHMSEEGLKEATREVSRLERMSPGSPEYTVARSYIDWLVALPWENATPDNLDITEVAKVLDEDHFGLDKVKDRILEYLSVRKFKAEGEIRQPILCLVGPPGVGKTSLAKSIARAMGKKFVRLSLGGVRDEAEVRGHRRTYIGALPGQIIQGIKRAGTNNPLFILDEIDKVSADYRGDPSSALLEVLDPEQNSTFRDNYLDVTFDLSKVLFMTTANMLDTIQPALRDRMEIIEIAGYTEEEKTEIAKRHLVPKQLAEHGLTSDALEFTNEGLRAVIAGYTREAGVRSLEREIASICRKATRKLAENPSSSKSHIPDSRERKVDNGEVVVAVSEDAGVIPSEAAGVIPSEAEGTRSPDASPSADTFSQREGEVDNGAAVIAASEAAGVIPSEAEGTRSPDAGRSDSASHLPVTGRDTAQSESSTAERTVANGPEPIEESVGDNRAAVGDDDALNLPEAGRMPLSDGLGKIVVDQAQVEAFLGAPRFEHEEVRERAQAAGVATGLVWTPVGGDIVFIEATRMEGGKNLQLTGQLGDVMRESALAALSYLRAHAEEFGIDPDFYNHADLHIHVPAGAVPKDGPSAGVTMTTALASLLTGRPVRPLLAMTGEVTLSGKVLPVGGIKEKVLGARRAGIRTIILPERNRKDLMEDIPDKLRADMNFIFATDVREVLHEALTPESKDDIRNHAGDLESLDETTRPRPPAAGGPDYRSPGDGGDVPTTGIDIPEPRMKREPIGV